MKNLRTIMIMAVAVVMSLSLAACGSKGTGTDISETQNFNVTTAPDLSGITQFNGEICNIDDVHSTSQEDSDDPNTVQFSGKIDSIDGDEAIVTPDEGEDILNSGDAVRVNIAKYSKPLKVGDAVTIYYDGEIMESYPLQINLLGISDEMFDIKEPSNSADSGKVAAFDNPEVLDKQ